MDGFSHEDVSLTENVHQLFKKDEKYIDPTESAASYDKEGKRMNRADSSALRGIGDIWASAQDISFWDIGLAGGDRYPGPGSQEAYLWTVEAAGWKRSPRCGRMAVL